MSIGTVFEGQHPCVHIVDFFCHCMFIASSRTIHSSLGTKCGENLYMSSDPTPWSDAIQNWYEERHNFVYGVGPKSSDAVIGHYTQVRMKILPSQML